MQNKNKFFILIWRQNSITAEKDIGSCVTSTKVNDCRIKKDNEKCHKRYHTQDLSN